MNTIFPEPPFLDLVEFIIHSCNLANISVSKEDVEFTINAGPNAKESNRPVNEGGIRNGMRFVNPIVFGHIRAMNTIVSEWAGTEEIPCRHISNTFDFAQADTACYWVRDIHRMIMEPISIHGTHNGEDVIRMEDVGNYRIDHSWPALDRSSIEPSCIPTMMHWWIKDVSKFHFDWIERIQTPASMSRLDWIAMGNRADLAATQLLCIRPFIDGNGRTARLVENLLRLCWGLPWIIPRSAKKLELAQKVMRYEDSQEWKNIMSNPHG